MSTRRLRSAGHVVRSGVSAQVSKVPQYKQVWKAGFPPKIVFSPLTELSNHEPVSRVLSDRDLITLEAASAKELTEAIARSAQEDAAKEPGTEQHGAAAQPSFAGGAAGGHGAACLPDASSPAAALRTAGPAAGTPVHVEDSSSPGSNPKVKRRKANFPGAARMLDAALDGPPPKDAAEAVKRTEDGAMTALLQAARGGAAAGVLLGADWSVGNKSLLRALRSDMRQAREGRAAEAEAHQKLAAARSGQVLAFPRLRQPRICVGMHNASIKVARAGVSGARRLIGCRCARRGRRHYPGGCHPDLVQVISRASAVHRIYPYYRSSQ